MPRKMNKKIWPYQITVKHLDESNESIVWLRKKFDKHQWYQNGTCVCFKDEKEYLMFCLKWS